MQNPKATSETRVRQHAVGMRTPPRPASYEERPLYESARLQKTAGSVQCHATVRGTILLGRFGAVERVG
ncbi:hypothetical protein GCM10007890_56500 [Methylobacterium tardum]|uniref:Uncharacterized protein n=1 Tax=Methylobacterium tardum TaxID=374432 RepID=A0AA37TKT8_9HYPH|nr:hypothetical protein GCM10007890_56500 [Methylobacterium tardum]